MFATNKEQDELFFIIDKEFENEKPYVLAYITASKNSVCLLESVRYLEKESLFKRAYTEKKNFQYLNEAFWAIFDHKNGY